MSTKNKVEQIAIREYVNHSRTFGRLKSRWEELLKRYENELRENSITSETQSQARLGQAFALVENFVSRIISQTPRFHYLPREKNDVSFIELYEEFNEYQHDTAQSKEKLEMVAKWGGICGLSGFKMGWKIEQILSKKKGKEVFGKVITNPLLVEMMDKMKLGNTIKIDDQETISNWTIDPITPFDLIWSVGATETEDCTVLGHKIHNKTFAQLRDEGYDVKKLSRRIKTDEEFWKKRVAEFEGNSESIALEETKVLIAELYVKYYNNGVWENWVVTLGDLEDGTGSQKPVAIRVEMNPLDKQFAPIGVFRPIKRPGKFYGFGIVEPVMGILDVEEDTLNMVTEAFWTDVARPMEYVPNNVIDEESLEFKPRTLVPVRRLGESINVIQTPKPDFAGTSYIHGFLEKTKQNVTAITDYQTGSNQLTNNQTATEVRTKTFLSEQRSNKILQRFEIEVLEVMGKYALWLNKQFLADEKKIVYRVLGKKGRMMEKTMTLKQVEAVKDAVIVSGSSAYVDRNNEVAKWMGLYQLALQEIQLGQLGIPVDREYILKKILEDGYGIKDPDNYIPSLKEREAEEVEAKRADLLQAKKENFNPATARVMPNDYHQEIHIPLHQAAIQAQGMTDENGKWIQYSPEQMQMLVEHMNEHVRLAGGSVPSFAQSYEQKASNQITQMNGPSNNSMPQRSEQRAGSTPETTGTDGAM